MFIRLFCLSLIIALACAPVILSAAAFDRFVELDEISAITLEKTPAFGNQNELITYQIVITPANGEILYRELRNWDGTVVCEEMFSAPRESMVTLAHDLQGLFMLPENIDADVLDGHYTYITVELDSGHTVCAGGLVAEESGLEDFRRAYDAIEALCLKAEESQAASSEDDIITPVETQMVDGSRFMSRKMKYGGSMIDILASALEISGDGFLLYGHTFSEDGDVDASAIVGLGEPCYAWALRVDAEGNICWQVLMESEHYMPRFRDAHLLPDGSIAVVFNEQIREGANWQDKLSLFILGDEGKTIRAVALPDNTRRVYFLQDGVLSVQGWADHLTLMSFKGEIIWTREEAGNLSISAALEHDGVIYLGGSVMPGAGNTPVMIKMTLDGEVEWIQEPSPAGAYHSIGGFLPIPDGGVFAVSAVQGNADNPFKEGRVLRLDTEGNILWESRLLPNGVENMTLTSILGYQGGVLVSGYDSDTKLTSMTPRLSYFNADGALVWDAYDVAYYGMLLEDREGSYHLFTSKYAAGNSDFDWMTLELPK